MRQQYSGVKVEHKSTLSGHGVRQTPSLAVWMQIAARNFKWLIAQSSTSSTNFKHCGLLWACSTRQMHMHGRWPREEQTKYSKVWRMWTHKEELKELAFTPQKQRLKERMVTDCEGVVQKTKGNGLFLISVRDRTGWKMGLHCRKEEVHFQESFLQTRTVNQ